MLGSIVSVLGEAADCEAALKQFGCSKLVVVERGTFTTRLTHLALHSIRLLRLQEMLSRVAVYQCPPGTRRFILPPESGELLCGGMRAEPGWLITHAASMVFERVFAPSESLSMLVPDALLTRVTKGTLGTVPNLPPGVLKWRPRAEHLAELRSLHLAATRMPPARLELAHGSAGYHGLEQQLTEHLVNCLAELGTGPETASSDGTPKALRDFDNAAGRVDWTVTQLCQEQQISPSALRRLFRSQLGLSPRDYLYFVKRRQATATANPASH